MIVNNSLDEVKKRESSLKIIKSIIENEGRDSLYDVTGLSGGFIASDEELNLLETYVGPAIFEDELQIVGRQVPESWQVFWHWLKKVLMSVIF